MQGLTGPKLWLTVLAVAFTAALGLVLLLTSEPGARWLELFSSVAAMERALEAYGAWAFAASVGLMVLHSFVPFPAELLAVANGMVFGFGLGVLATWSGAMIGGLLAFGLARWLGQPFVRRMAGERRWREIERFSAGYGAGALLLLRLTPVISFNLVNYAAGLAGVGWWTFAWTTALGILPVTVLSVVVGSHMIDAPWPLWGVVFALVAAGVVVHWRYRARARALIRGETRAFARGESRPAERIDGLAVSPAEDRE